MAAPGGGGAIAGEQGLRSVEIAERAPVDSSYRRRANALSWFGPACGLLDGIGTQRHHFQPDFLQAFLPPLIFRAVFHCCGGFAANRNDHFRKWPSLRFSGPRMSAGACCCPWSNHWDCFGAPLELTESRCRRSAKVGIVHTGKTGSALRCCSRGAGFLGDWFVIVLPPLAPELNLGGQELSEQ